MARQTHEHRHEKMDSEVNDFPDIFVLAVRRGQ